MPTPTYTALANINPTAGASSITFSSIPATYRDLYIVIGALAQSAGDAISLRFNSDTGTNYSTVYASGSGSATSSGALTTNKILLNANVTTNTTVGTIICNIMDYCATDKHKATLSRTNQASGTGSYLGVEVLAGRWANTGAITSVEVLNGTLWATGSTVALYGIAA